LTSLYFKQTRGGKHEDSKNHRHDHRRTHYQSIRSKMVSVAPQPWIASDNWRFEPTASGTKVTWTIEGSLGYPVERVFGLFMESMLGPTCEKGLANLKKVSEAQIETPVSQADNANGSR
jgi:hypothetical protein